MESDMIKIMSDSLFTMLDQLPGTIRHFVTGDVIFRAADPVSVLHRVMDGQILLLRHQPHGTTLVVQRASAPALLAEASIFASAYHCDAVAKSAVVTRAIDIIVMREVLRHNQDLNDACMAYLAREVLARLDAWLAENGGHLPVRGGQSLLAVEIGVSPEAFYRELARRRQTR
jgi:CRP/FNR family transcriptional regulator, dissimilatory nitrate respiration regulator